MTGDVLDPTFKSRNHRHITGDVLDPTFKSRNHRHMTGDVLDPTFKSLPLEDPCTVTGKQYDSLPVLKLQAPPKAKCKRQLSSDSDIQSSVSTSGAFLPAVIGTCQNSRELQLQETDLRFQHNSSSSSCSFSPKKFKSHLGPVPSPSRGHAAPISPTHTTSLQNMADSISRDTQKYACSDSHFTLSYSTSAKLLPDSYGNSQDSGRYERGKKGNSFVPLQACFQVPSSDYVNAEGLASKNRYSRIKMSPADGRLTETQNLDSSRVESAFKNKASKCEPDIFVFPEAGGHDSISFPRLDANQTDEPDGLDSPMEMEECSNGMNDSVPRSRCNMYQNYSFQHSTSPLFSRPFNSSSSLEGSMKESVSFNAYKDLTHVSFSPHEQLQTCRKSRDKRPAFHIHSATEQPVKPTGSFSSVSANDKRDVMTLSDQEFMSGSGRNTYPMRFASDGPSEQFVFSSNRRIEPHSQHFVNSNSHYSRTYFEHNKHENAQGHRESSNSSMKEILDTSESDDLSQYLAADESISCGIYAVKTKAKPICLIRKLDANNNSMGKKVGNVAGDDYPVQTTADTNVCYIALNDLNSSTSSNDMDHDYDNNKHEQTIHVSGISHQDFYDEPDGKDKKLSWRQETVNKKADHMCKSLVTNNIEPHYTSNNQVLENDHHPKTKDYNNHTSNISLSGSLGKTQISPARIYSSSVQEITFRREDKNLTSVVSSGQPVSLSGKLKFQSNDSAQSAHTTCGNQEKLHPWLPDWDRNRKNVFPAHTEEEAFLCSDTAHLLERKQYRRNVTNYNVYQTVHQHVRDQHNDESTDNEGNETLADEVDGLGDDKKEGNQALQSTDPRQGSSEKNIVHCFDKNNQMDKAPKALQSTPEQLHSSDQVDLARGSHDMPSKRDTLQVNLQLTRTGKEVKAPLHEMLEPVNKTQDFRLSSQMGTGEYVYTETEQAEEYQLQKEIPDNQHLDASQKHAGVCHSLDVRIRRRKSDTSIMDVTGTYLSRSKSSPSKLGLTEDACLERKVTFHRPWLDQPLHESHTKILPKATLVSVGSSAHLRRMTYPTNMDHMCAPDDQLVHSDDCKPGKSGKSGNVPCPPYLKSKGDNRKSEEDNVNQSKDLSAGPSKSVQQHDMRLTEGRPKRKLEFCTHEFRSHPPTRQEVCPVSLTPRQVRQPFQCSSAQDQQEPGNNSKNHKRRTHKHEFSRGQNEDKTLTSPGELNSSISSSRQQGVECGAWSSRQQGVEGGSSTSSSKQQGVESAAWSCRQQGVEGGASTSSSRQQGAESGTCLRNDDEVDIRLQVSDVFQESALLFQELNRIYQADDRSCDCSRIEQSILSVALDMFRTLGSEVCSRENWLGELQRTNHVIRGALDIAENCRRLCSHGRQVTDVLSGSVIIRMKCRTLSSVVDLCNLHASGDLHMILYSIMRQQVTFNEPGLTLSVTLDKESVQTCKEYLLTRMEKPLKTRSRTRPRSPKKVAPRKIVVRSLENLLHSPADPVSPGHGTTELCNSPVSSVSPYLSAGVFTPLRERKFSFGEINRTAFQELNISDTGSPSSPSYFRCMRDESCQTLGKPDLILPQPHRLSSPNVLTSPKVLMSPGSSPLMSPRKLKVCDIRSEQENIDQDNG